MQYYEKKAQTVMVMNSTKWKVMM